MARPTMPETSWRDTIRAALAEDRATEDATTALSVVLAGEGVWGLRVHDVRSTRDALRVLYALDTAREEGDHLG